MGCHGVLDVSNPTVIQDGDIANAGGANARRLDVVSDFSNRLARIAADVALFTDERVYDRRSAPQPSYGDPDLVLDRRNSQEYEQFGAYDNSDRHLGWLDEIVTKSAIAIPAVHAYAAAANKNDFLAQLFAMRGYAILQMAEDVCPGFPINDVSPNNLPIFSRPYTTDSALTYAIAQFDSALAFGHDSTQFLDFARVAKGRALLDLGQFSQAASVVGVVATSFAYTTDPSVRGNDFAPFQINRWSFNPMAVGNLEWGSGLPFVTANDPRVPTTFVQTRFGDPSDSLYDQLKYPDATTPMVLASGIEARLIEAEAALNSGDASWLVILNTLRSSLVVPSLPALDDPGTMSGDIDLLYQERAFWLYLTGHRLGDLRRLIRVYGRSAASVFPSGAPYPLGGTYGAATSIPFVQVVEAQYNPNITSGCTSR